MRIKILILSSLLLLAFSAINAYSVDWDNPGSQTVDQMISSGEQGVNNTSPDKTPWESRAAQVGQKGKDILSQQIGGKLNAGGLSAKESRNQEQTQTVSTQPLVVNNTTPVQSEPAEVPDISGTWSIGLVDSASRNATITLLQSAGGAVYGKGTIMEGNDTFTIAASGSIAGDQLRLDLVSLEKLGLYRLDLTISADSATGSYEFFSAALEAPQSGTANAMKI